MAGGTFKKANEKVLPGAYINVASTKQSILASESDRGTVFTVVQGTNWGDTGVTEVNATSDFRGLFGAEITDAALAGLFWILRTAPKALVFNLNSGAKASASNEVLPWTFEASHSGTVGNAITVIVTPDFNAIGRYTVQTLLGTDVVNTQSIAKASELQSSAYIVPTVKSAAIADDGLTLLSALETPVTVSLSGGTTEPESDSIDALIEAIETSEFNVITAAGQAATSGIHKLIATKAINLREDEGKKVQAVVPTIENYDPDHEGVIIVANGVKLSDGTVLEATVAAGYVAGATAAAEANVSLTYRSFPYAVDAVPRFNRDARVAKLKSGQMVFISERGAVKIESDINSLHSFTKTKNISFSKNRVLRVLDEIANNTRTVWEDNFIGDVTNDSDGRDLFKADRAQFLTELQASGAIQNFETDDITVVAGDEKDTIIVNVTVQPTDAMEKLYMTVTVS